MTRRGTVRAIGLTDRGQVRQENEDAVLLFDWHNQSPRPQPVEFRTAFTPPLICAVADGMGGHVAGAVASRLALLHVTAGYEGWTDSASLTEGLIEVNRKVSDAGRADPATTGMGTTVAGVILGPDQALCFNVGDSRVYQLTDGFAEQLTTDDAVLDARGMPTNRLTQAIGDIHPVTPHVVEVPYQDAHTRFLLCTDGISGVIEPALVRKLCRPRRLDRVVLGLAEAAHEAGAPDNLSIVAVDVRLALS